MTEPDPEVVAIPEHEQEPVHTDPEQVPRFDDPMHICPECSAAVFDGQDCTSPHCTALREDTP